MYSVEIRVQRDRATGATKVLSSSTRLPVDLQTHGVKVYEDEQKGDSSLTKGSDVSSVCEVRRLS